jgi:hypothetical protein
MSEDHDQRLLTVESVAAPPVTMFFPVSPLKLILMSICTFGVYDVFWFYMNWGYVNRREQQIRPFLRAIFWPLFCYPLFRRIHLAAESQGTQRSFAPIPLAAGWVILRLLGGLPDPGWPIGLFSVLCLVPVQATVNEINLATNPQHNRNSRFTGWNIAALAIGGGVLILALIGTFVSVR